MDPRSSDQHRENRAPHTSRHALGAIAAAAAVLLLVLVIAFSRSRPGDYAGSEDVAAIVRATQKTDPSTLEPLGIAAHAVGDWLLSKGFEGYRVPQALDDTRVESGTIIRHDGSSVAVLLFADGVRASVFSESSSDLGLGREWTFYDVEPSQGGSRTGVAAQQENGVCFVLSSADKTPFLQNWLARRGSGAD